MDNFYLEKPTREIKIIEPDGNYISGYSDEKGNGFTIDKYGIRGIKGDFEYGHYEGLWNIN